MLNIIKKFQELWNPIAEEQSEQPVVESASNVIDFRAELIEKIVKNHFFKRYSMDEEVTDPFILWVTTEGQNYQTVVRKPDFIRNLRKAFDDAELPEVGSKAEWIVRTEPLPQGVDFYKIDEGIYLDIIQPVPPEPPRHVPTKARIHIAENSGSLLRYEYLLDAKKQQVWQIGRGEKDKTEKKNHIAISDNEKDRWYENNKYVSNVHAQIIFIANKGFCVKSLNDSNRTIIYRNENRVADIQDLHSISIPLQDGDYIELGKKVLLKFEIINQEEDMPMPHN